MEAGGDFELQRGEALMLNTIRGRWGEVSLRTASENVQATGALRQRSEIPEEMKWRLEDIFADDGQWEQAFRELQSEVERAGRFKGRVGESAATLLACFEMEDEIGQALERVYGYAVMRRDEDNNNSTYQAMAQRAISLWTQLSSALSYIEPEILAIPEETIDTYLNEEPKLTAYRHTLDNLARMKPHVLSPREEELLAQVRELTQGPETTFEMLNYADFKFGSIEGEDGNQVEVTLGRYAQCMRSSNRRVRKDAYERLFSKYDEYKNGLAANFATSVQADWFFARTRNFSSSLEAALKPDNVPVSVYDSLIEAVRKNLPTLHRYLRLRKKALELDELFMYDIMAPLVRNVDYKVPYEQSRAIVMQALAPLGQQYLDELERAFSERWIDVYENVGKTAGGYQRDVYSAHPYILLNYQGELSDLFTLVHELGHALHSRFTQMKQPYHYSGYSIFVAEVASTVNEAMLVHYLLDSETDPRRRLFILNHYLEEFRSVVFLQTMFAEFEKAAHELAEKGEPLTVDAFCQVYDGLNKAYWGPEVTIDDLSAMGWSRIPHFFSAFYVYKYATGFAAANALTQGILSGSADAVQRYIDFLSAGSSLYPLDALKQAGVDMTSPDPVNEALAVFERLLDETEALIRQPSARG